MQARPLRIEVLGSGLRGLPVMRQQFGEPGDGMGSDAREDILEPGVGIDSHALARGHETLAASSSESFPFAGDSACACRACSNSANSASWSAESCSLLRLRLASSSSRSKVSIL